MVKSVDRSLEIVNNGAALDNKLKEMMKIVDYIAKTDFEIKNCKKPNSAKNVERKNYLIHVIGQLIPLDLYRGTALKCFAKNDYEGIRDIAFKCMKTL